MASSSSTSHFDDPSNITEFGKKFKDINCLLRSINFPCFLSANQPKSLFDTLKVDGTIVHPSDPMDRNFLISVAQPAPFGRGYETMFEDTVRKALEITADRLVVDEAPVVKILEEIEKTWSNYRFDANLYKMHIYQETGHFTMHRDMVRDPSHIATLFVILNEPEEGGDLLLGRNNEYPTGRPLGWCAFFADCPYEVTKVEKGCLIVLQYDLDAKLRGVNDRIENHEEDGSKNTVFPAVVKHQIKEELCALCTPDSKQDVVLFCRHSYVDTPPPQYLKGVDFELYQLVKEMEEMESELVQVFIECHYSLDYQPWVKLTPILPPEDEKPIIYRVSVRFGQFSSESYYNEVRQVQHIQNTAALIMRMKSRRWKSWLINSISCFCFFAALYYPFFSN